MRTVAVASLALALLSGNVEAFAPTSARLGVTSTALSAYVPDGFTAESYKKVCTVKYRTLGEQINKHLLTILLPLTVQGRGKGQGGGEKELGRHGPTRIQVTIDAKFPRSPGTW